MTLKVLIIGATSAIAEAVARAYAAQGAHLFLVGRNPERLALIAGDLKARGANETQVYVLDVNRISECDAMLSAAWEKLGAVDVALIAHGTLPDQARCQTDATYAIQEFQTNAVSVIGLLTLLAARFERQCSGVIAAISSVAGDRGRPSNYLYGAAKGAIAIFLQGLRARLATCGVHVLTIKPGFVATPMTAHLNLPQKLTASPRRVAHDIVRAIEARKNSIYTPWFWWGIMTIIKNIPEGVFKKLKL